MHDRTLGSLRNAIHFAVFGVVAVLVALAGCSKSSTTKPQPGEPLLYGSLVTPKNFDPFFSDAYQTLTVDHCQVAHLAISWGAIEKGPRVFDWSSLDRHVQKAVPEGMKLSIAIEFIHGGQADLPAYRWPEFPGWDDSTLQVSLASFIRTMRGRFSNNDALHTVGWLWLGEGPDRFAAAFPGEETAMAAFYHAIADSARRIFPYAQVGTIITPALLQETGGESLIRSLRQSLDVIGLSVFPEDRPGPLEAPQAALQTMIGEIAPWQDRAIVVLEAGYPSDPTLGSDETKQTAFAGLLAQWLHGRPSTLKLFCWSPLHDTNASLSDSLALRRFPSAADSAARVDFARRIATMSLHRIDGTTKPARQTWMDARP